MRFVNFWNFILETIPKANGVKINNRSWMKDSAPSISKSLDLEVTMVSQNIIVSGEIIEAKEVKNTDNGTFPPLICESKPDTWPPGTIKTITAAIANKVLLNISEIRSPISGSKMSWMPRP